MASAKAPEVELTNEEQRIKECLAYFDDPKEKHLGYILSIWKKDKNGIPSEWVFHTHNKEDHGFSSGHYFRDLSEAIKYYDQRKKNGGRA